MADRDELERQLEQCIRLAYTLTDKAAVERLTAYADELDAKIRALDDAGD